MMLASLGFSAGCATTQSASVADQQRCEEMARTMGTGTTHDHNQMKGQGTNPMNVTHERCQQTLANPTSN